jgi:hypothetical protein
MDRWLSWKEKKKKRQERMIGSFYYCLHPGWIKSNPAVLLGTAEFLSTPDNPRGCLLIQGALACGTDAEHVKLSMIDWRKSGEAALKKRLQQAQSGGELPAEIPSADFACYLSSIMAGLGVQAANGATRTELGRVAEISLRCIEARALGFC